MDNRGGGISRSSGSSQESRVKDIIVDSRINKVLEMRTDTVAMLEALDAISEFYVSNTVEARRALRQDLELQNITLARKFLLEFDEVRGRIENVESLSSNLETMCASLNSKVSEADENMKAFMEKASQLENRRNFFKEQGQAISVFLAKFQLSAEEVDTLYRAPIDQRSGATAFFAALQRLKVAYADCKAMVEKHCYSAGFELLDALGQHQARAYQRLFEWVKRKCEALAESGDASSAEDMDGLLHLAIRSLRRLPIYFSQCQDLVVTSRRAQLVHRFISALTQGGPSGQVFRALDLHAHDPLRYAGDMLAWMHQAVAGEGELLEAIFGDASGGVGGSSCGGGGGGGGEDGEGGSGSGRNGTKAGAATKGRADSLDLAVAAVADDKKKRPGSEPTTSSSSEPAPNPATDDPSLRGLSVPELLARCLQGLGRPLRARLTQTLETAARGGYHVHSGGIGGSSSGSGSSGGGGGGSGAGGGSGGGPEVLYALSDLLCFYEKTFRQQQRVGLSSVSTSQTSTSSVGDAATTLAPAAVITENAVHSTVRGCLLECKRLLALSVKQQGEGLISSPPSYPLDLSASHVAREVGRQAAGVLKVYAEALSPLPMAGASSSDATNSDPAVSSMAAGSGTEQQGSGSATLLSSSTKAEDVVGALIQPLLQACRLGASQLPAGDATVFMLNNIAMLQRDLRSCSLAATPAADPWVQRLTSDSLALVSALASDEAQRILNRSELNRFLADARALGVPCSLGPLANQPGLSQDRLATCVRAFYSSLFSSSVGCTPQFERLQDPDTRELARRQTAEMVAAVHSEVHAMALDPTNGYEAGAILVHSVDEVRVLLGCT